LGPDPNRSRHSQHGYLDATVFYEPRSFSHEDFIEVMKSQSVPIPSNAMPVLKDLAHSGQYLVGTLNNGGNLLAVNAFYLEIIIGALILTVLDGLLTLLDSPEPIKQILYGAIIFTLAAAYSRLTA